ncbi:hypothetical protein [Streptomyces sp. NBC_01445]|uniref:hypothetical protein n=1 Tax=Streptomyces sp. NBC_01445 TaxID=2903869 RepID=UPI002DD7B2C0|nr:hypothetical protein [Streptomyces sp. NBC_01445]WSE10106.1 hypothetical protein OG574_46395 [Streptomyces sp. NBC_01445]
MRRDQCGTHHCAISQGVEGVVRKRASSPYRTGHIWQKVRHSDTVDTDVVGSRTGWRGWVRTGS